MKGAGLSSVLLLPLDPVGSDRKVDVGRRGGGAGCGQNTRDKQGRIGMDTGQRWNGRGGRESLVWSGSLAWQRGGGGSGDGHLIWIGSSQPNVSAGSQHAW